MTDDDFMAPSVGSSLLPEAPHPTRTVELLMHAVRPPFEDSESRSEVITGGSSSSSSTAAPFSTKDLVRHWWHQAEDTNRRNGAGALTKQDKQVIALRVCQIMQEMDLRSKGHVDSEEWVHYTMLKHSDRSAVQINSLLREALRRHPQFLEDLQRLFKAADVAKNGRLSFREVAKMYTSRLWHIHPSSDLLSEAELQEGDPEQFARDIIKAMDVDGDETISYAEFMAFCLGRRKQQVTLHMYDLSGGLGKSLKPILGEELQSIWHTGIVVYGREYFWASDCVHDVPGETSFGIPTKVVTLGFTLWRQDELHDFIISELQSIFHRDTYDHITNNCNHFSDRLCQYLLGRHLPDEVLLQTKHLLKLTTVKLLRPLLQWYCRENLGPGKGAPVAKTAKWDAVDTDAQLPVGTIVEMHQAEDRSDGHMILGVVCDPVEGHPKRVLRELNRSKDFIMPTPLAFCSCNTIEHISTDEVWVRYFDISLDRSLHSCRGQVRSEPLPRSRLSVTKLESNGTASVYHAAMLMMNATTQRRNAGASSGLNRPSQSAIPSMALEDEVLLFHDDVVDDTGFSARTLGSNGSSTLWAVMAPPARTDRERGAVEELVSRGFDEQAASAALASTDWQLEEANALLVARERLRDTVARPKCEDPNGKCHLKPRLGLQSRPGVASEDGPRSSPLCQKGTDGRSERLLEVVNPACRPGKVDPDMPVEPPPEPLPSRSVDGDTSDDPDAAASDFNLVSAVLTI